MCSFAISLPNSPTSTYLASQWDNYRLLVLLAWLYPIIHKLKNNPRYSSHLLRFRENKQAEIGLDLLIIFSIPSETISSFVSRACSEWNSIFVTFAAIIHDCKKMKMGFWMDVRWNHFVVKWSLSSFILVSLNFFFLL